MSAYLDYAKNQLEKLRIDIENDQASVQAKLWIKKTYIEKYNIDHDCAAHGSLLWFIKIPEFNSLIEELIEIVIDFKIKSLLTIFDIDKSELFNLQHKNELYGAFLESNRQSRLEIDEMQEAENQLLRVKEFVNKEDMPSVKAKTFIREIFIHKYYIEPIHAAHAALLWFVKIPEYNEIIGELIEAIIEHKMNLLILSFQINHSDLLNIKDKSELYCAFLDLNRQAHIEV